MQVTTQNVDEVLGTLRFSRRLRALTASESGRSMTDISPCTYFFFIGLGDFSLAEHSVRRYPLGNYAFEFHKTIDDGLFLIAFLSEAEAARIGDAGGENIEREVTLSPRPWGAVSTLMSIRFDDLRILRRRKIEVTESEEIFVVDAVI
jgi:hypothetical protein